MAHGDIFAVLAILDSLTGGEVVMVMVIALLVLGPDRLPDAMKTLGVWVSKLRSMTSDLQSEVREVFEDPSMQPIREVGEFMASPRRKLVEYATAAEAEAAADAIAVSEAMAATGVDPVADAEAHEADDGGSVDSAMNGAVPTDDAHAPGSTAASTGSDQVMDPANTAGAATPAGLASDEASSDQITAAEPYVDPVAQHLAARVAALAAEEAERNKRAAFGFYEAL